MKRLFFLAIATVSVLFLFTQTLTATTLQSSVPTHEFRASGGGFILFILIIYVIIRFVSGISNAKGAQTNKPTPKEEAQNDLVSIVRNLQNLMYPDTSLNSPEESQATPPTSVSVQNTGKMQAQNRTRVQAETGNSGESGTFGNRSDLKYSPEQASDAMISMMPLWEAAGRGKLDTAKRKLQQGANVNEPDTFFHETPLHRAAKNGDAAMVQLLLQHRASLSAVTNYGETPLHFAICGRNPEVVRLLARAGANLQAKDCFGRTPVQCAKFYPELKEALNESLQPILRKS